MVADYSILYLEVNLLSLALIAIILRKTNGLSKMVAQRNFVMSIAAEMVFFASDTLKMQQSSSARNCISFPPQ